MLHYHLAFRNIPGNSLSPEYFQPQYHDILVQADDIERLLLFHSQHGQIPPVFGLKLSKFVGSVQQISKFAPQSHLAAPPLLGMPPPCIPPPIPPPSGIPVNPSPTPTPSAPVAVPPPPPTIPLWHKEYRFTGLTIPLKAQALRKLIHAGTRMLPGHLGHFPVSNLYVKKNVDSPEGSLHITALQPDHPIFFNQILAHIRASYHTFEMTFVSEGPNRPKSKSQQSRHRTGTAAVTSATAPTSAPSSLVTPLIASGPPQPNGNTADPSMSVPVTVPSSTTSISGMATVVTVPSAASVSPSLPPAGGAAPISGIASTVAPVPAAPAPSPPNVTPALGGGMDSPSPDPHFKPLHLTCFKDTVTLASFRQWFRRNPHNSDQYFFGTDYAQDCFGANFKIFTVAGDGKCALRALAALLHGNENDWRKVHKEGQKAFRSRSVDSYLQECLNDLIFAADQLSTVKAALAEHFDNPDSIECVDEFILAFYAKVLDYDIDIYSLGRKEKALQLKKRCTGQRREFPLILLNREPSNYPILDGHKELIWNHDRSMVQVLTDGHYWAVKQTTRAAARQASFICGKPI